ncbi:hypothetical protein GCM10027270_12200 [Nocardioides ginkgobilobae]
MRVLLVGTTTYAGLVLVLRVSGKRTLAKLNGSLSVVPRSSAGDLGALVDCHRQEGPSR